MDSLKIISDINDHLTILDNKVEKTSKSASVAFSYLYNKIGQVDNCVTTVTNLDNKVSYISSNVEKSNLYSYSYFTSLNANIIDMKLSNNVTINNLEDKLSDEIMSINKKIKELDKNINELIVKVNNIIECPNKYIMVKEEPPIIIKFFRGIYTFFYQIFHAKQIRKTKEEIIELENKKSAEEAERKRRIEAEKKQKQAQEKLDKQNKIKDLLRK